MIDDENDDDDDDENDNGEKAEDVDWGVARVGLAHVRGRPQLHPGPGLLQRTGGRACGYFGDLYGDHRIAGYFALQDAVGLSFLPPDDSLL